MRCAAKYYNKTAGTTTKNNNTQAAVAFVINCMMTLLTLNKLLVIILHCIGLLAFKRPFEDSTAEKARSCSGLENVTVISYRFYRHYLTSAICI